jgi:ribosomal protein S12 methylthiotransferase accessory factor
MRPPAPERSVPTQQAIAAVCATIEQEGLRATLSRHRTGPDRSFPDVSCRLLRGSRVISQSRGKGYRDQAVASALFECIEHAVTDSVAFRGPETGIVCIERSALSSLVAGHDALVALALEEGPGVIPSVAFRTIAWGPRPVETHHLPAALVELPMHLPDQGPLRTIGRYSSSNGIAAGMTLDDASLHAVNEVLERDAISALMLASGRRRPYGALLRTGGDEQLQQAVTAVSSYADAAVHLLEVPALAGHCVVAFTDRFDTHGLRLIGAGASPILDHAAERAVLELQQNLAAEDEPGATTEDGDVLHLRLVERFPFLWAAATLADLRPAAERAIDPSAHLPVHRCLATLLDQLSEKGHPVLRRLMWAAAGDSDDPCPQVVQIVVAGAERLHLARAGLPVECIGRLRTEDTLASIRSR